MTGIGENYLDWLETNAPNRRTIVGLSIGITMILVSVSMTAGVLSETFGTGLAVLLTGLFCYHIS